MNECCEAKISFVFFLILLLLIYHVNCIQMFALQAAELKVIFIFSKTDFPSIHWIIHKNKINKNNSTLIHKLKIVSSWQFRVCPSIKQELIANQTKRLIAIAILDIWIEILRHHVANWKDKRELRP